MQLLLLYMRADLVQTTCTYILRPHVYEAAVTPPTILPWTCIMIFSLSSGAVNVLPSAPAAAPARNNIAGSEALLSRAPG